MHASQVEVSRRSLILGGVAFGAWQCPARSFTLEEVTPATVPSSPDILTPRQEKSAVSSMIKSLCANAIFHYHQLPFVTREAATVTIFERNTYSVVNVVDVGLQVGK